MLPNGSRDKIFKNVEFAKKFPKKLKRVRRNGKDISLNSMFKKISQGKDDKSRNEKVVGFSSVKVKEPDHRPKLCKVTDFE